MKTFKTILYMMLFAICFMACSDDNNNIQFTKGDIPRDIAYELALKKLNVSLKDVDIWATKEKLPANLKMNISWFSVSSPETESWLFFVDDKPMANWDHDCRYVFVDMNGRVHIHKKSSPPNLSTYNMERINTSDWSMTTSKEQKKSSYKPQKSRSITTLLENHYAIILSGGKNKDWNHTRYWNDCKLIYNTLLYEYGYNPSKVYVLMADGTDSGVDNPEGYSSNPDLNDDGIADIDYAATSTNLTNLFDSLSMQLTDDDYLFIYTIDHGGIDKDKEQDESFIDMWNEHRYYASDFADRVKAINTKATHIVMGQCNSGGFIPYFTDSPNICISTACEKYENSSAITDPFHPFFREYDEYVYYWALSHDSLAGDANNDGHVSALESHNYAKSRDTQQEETPQHYGAGYLSEKLTLTTILTSNYGSYIDGYCVFNNETNNEYPFYLDEPNHEPEFGVACGDKIDINITYPEIGLNSFSWSVVENNSYTAVFTPNNTSTHMEIRNQAPVGQRVRVKVEANIPLDNYYVSQYLNFYITSNYRIARSGSNVLSIENTNTDDSTTTYALNSSASTFTYQIMDEGTNHVRMSGSYPKAQKLDLDISQLPSGVYTLIVKENGEVKANQRLTI